MRDKSRKTMSISEVVGVKDNEVILQPLFKFEEDMERTSVKKVVGTLKRTEFKMAHPEKFINSGIYDYL